MVEEACQWSAPLDRPVPPASQSPRGVTKPPPCCDIWPGHGPFEALLPAARQRAGAHDPVRLAPTASRNPTHAFRSAGAKHPPPERKSTWTSQQEDPVRLGLISRSRKSALVSLAEVRFESQRPANQRGCSFASGSRFRLGPRQTHAALQASQTSSAGYLTTNARASQRCPRPTDPRWGEHCNAHRPPNEGFPRAQCAREERQG
jgi:hypothetical protein